MDPTKKEWHDAISNAPDTYEIHTTIKRRKVGPAGRETWREDVIERKIVAEGRILYTERS